MIFGSGAPEISNTASGSYVLNYSTVLDNFNESRTREIISLTGERNFITDNYASFIIYVNLYKNITPVTDLQAILQYEKTKVKFKRHYDEPDTLYNGDFYVTEIIPFYLETTDYKDKVLIKLTSAPTVVFYKSGYGKYYGQEYGKRGW